MLVDANLREIIVAPGGYFLGFKPDLTDDTSSRTFGARDAACCKPTALRPRVQLDAGCV